MPSPHPQGNQIVHHLTSPLLITLPMFAWSGTLAAQRHWLASAIVFLLAVPLCFVASVIIHSAFDFLAPSRPHS